MLQIVKSRSFRIAAIVISSVALLVGLYAIAGFVLAPKLIRSTLLEDIPKSIDAKPTVGEIKVNPFLLQVTVDDFGLAGADGAKLLGFRRLFIDFQLSSLWHRAYTFANIDIAAPQVSAVMGQNGVLNLLQLRPKPSNAPPKAKQDENAPLPSLRIGSFKVLDGLVTYEDHSRPDVFAARLEPINFELRDFTTGVEGGKFTFTGSSKLGERLEWHGHISVDPLESDGEFQVDGLRAHTLWEYLQDQVNFAIDTGSIDVAGTYKFSVKNADSDNLNVDVSKVALRDLAVRLKSAAGAAEPPWITLPALDVSGVTMDLAARRAHVDRVALTGLKVVTWLEPDGSLNLMKLAAPPPASESVPTKPPAPTLTAPTLTATMPAGPARAPWAFDLGEFDLAEATVSTEDRGVAPVVKVRLAPLSVQVKGITQDLGKPLTLILDTHFNETGSVDITGEVTPQPALANLNVKLANLDLGLLQPYVAQHTAMTLVSGELGGDLKVHYGAEPKMPAIQLSGNVAIDKLHTIDNTLRNDFIDWDRLDILGLNYRHEPDRLDIDQIVGHRLYARVIIEADESMNVKRVLEIPSDPPPAVKGAAPGKAAASDKMAVVAAEPSSSKARKSGSKGKTPVTAKGAAAPATAPMPMAIKRIVLQASQMNFTDMSVKPNFSAGIQSLEGSVTGLSTVPGSRAKVDLHGEVDKFSPVTINGELNVLGRLYTDITMGFHNISLAVFNPYSGKFAGYNITKGKLTTDLHYQVDGRKLDAQHHVVIEDLEFGDKTASKDAVSLPIKLAVSLLKDRNGVIDLSIPVTGSLDDPQFRLAPIIWKVFVNLLEKAVTAPFALLGSMFGGGPDIQYIDFRPGESTLDGAAADKAKSMVKALVERPQLKIDVPLGVVADVDGPALVEAAFRAEVSSAQSTKGAPKKAAAAGAAAPPAYDRLDPSVQVDLLTRIYAKDFGGEPKFPESVTGLKSKSDVIAAKVDFLGQAIRGHITVGEGELRTLGQQRAQAVQAALLADSGITPERVFLVANDKATAQGDTVRLELTLE